MFSQQPSRPPPPPPPAAATVAPQETAPTSTTQKIPTMAFSPTNPAALIFPNTKITSKNASSSSTTTVSNAAFQVDIMLSHTGVGCNEHELVTLSQLVEASNRHAQLESENKRQWITLKSLSKSYRAALRDCLCRWEDNLLELEEQGDTATTTTPSGGSSSSSSYLHSPLQYEHLELLKLVYAVSHLSEIFLILPPTSVTSLDYYDSIWDIPGALTADTVRYLRHHHTLQALSPLPPDVVQEVLESAHPDQVDHGAPYWQMIHRLVRKGNVHQAWALLSRHSLCRRATVATNDRNRSDNIDDNGNNNNDSDNNNDGGGDYEHISMIEIYQGFDDLRRILLSAPLPGGRDDIDDADLEEQDNEDLENGDDVNTISPSLARGDYLEHVEPDGYLRWETSRNATRTNNSGDFPSTYTPTLASRVFQAWQQYIVELPSLRTLQRKVPQLEGIFQILLGNVRHLTFETWPEALLCELLYRNPMLLPSHIYTRAAKLQQRWAPKEQPSQPRSNESLMNEVVMNIMQGSVGSAMDMMFAFGGGSGAALPATMTSLLCNLFIDADHELPKQFQTDFLNAAAFALSSSLANTSQDLATRLVVQLLVPFCTPSADPSVVATLGLTLEHYTPSSDVEARNLLEICRPLVEQESIRTLDGCVSMVLSRYRSYLRENRPSGALHWLLLGIEMESLLCLGEDGTLDHWQTIEAKSVCYRHLITWCGSVASNLLQHTLDQKEGLGMLYHSAKDMIKAAKEGPLETYVVQLPEVQTLELVAGMFDGLTDQDYTLVARNITLSLQEEARAFDNGVVSALAPRSMHWNLLQLGQRVLERDEREEVQSQLGDFTPSFNVKGIQVLLEHLIKIELGRELEGLKPLPSDVLQRMKLSLGVGLKRAFVAENALRKPDRSDDIDAIMISKIKSVDLNKYSLATQEKVVLRMLDI